MTAVYLRVTLRATMGFLSTELHISRFHIAKQTDLSMIISNVVSVCVYELFGIFFERRNLSVSAFHSCLLET